MQLSNGHCWGIAVFSPATSVFRIKMDYYTLPNTHFNDIIVMIYYYLWLIWFLFLTQQLKAMGQKANPREIAQNVVNKLPATDFIDKVGACERLCHY